MRGRWGWAAVLGMGLAACGGEPPAQGSPDVSLEALEAVLTESSTPVHLPFTVEADGAVEAALTGDLFLGAEGEARLQAEGTFAGRPLDVLLVSDGTRMTWTGQETPVSVPSGLRDALVVGLTRMGILHNLARLSGGAPPDHMEGGVRDWVVLSPDTAGAAPEAVEAGPDLARTITVAGTPSGSFRLVFGPGGAAPRVRRQGVDFPQGRMDVVERYPTLALGAVLPDSLFALPGPPAPARDDQASSSP